MKYPQSELIAATHGLEGLSNLQNTMHNNGLQCPELGVRQNKGRRGVAWGLVSGSWCRQAFVGKTDKFKRLNKGRSKSQ